MLIKDYHESGQTSQIGIILNLTTSHPRDSNNSKGVRATEIADIFYNRSFLYPTVKGTFPELLVKIAKKLDMIPDMQEKDFFNIIKNNPVDLLGIDYYQPQRIMSGKYLSIL
ncbi:family 1 glycosylhydrolase [Enterococcus sp. DIV0086]|uniref:family 1 glycosylhydrolase n=1 Tax=Enterococcus sp. DIV0086 TaxID=2774655 RepID=UPI003D2E0AD7